MEKIITHSRKEMQILGREAGAICSGQEVFVLSGDLGAGKTTFLQGLAQGLGVTGQVNSPTFNILKLYKTKKGSVVKSFCHIDAYRLSSAQDLKALGIEEILADKEMVVAIEWAEKVKAIWPRNKIKIKFKHLQEDERILEITDDRKNIKIKKD